MPGPNLAQAVLAILAGKQKWLDLLDQLEAISPDALKGTEEELKAAIAELPAVDSAALSESLAAALIVVKAGRGISGGGFNAMLS